MNHPREAPSYESDSSKSGFSESLVWTMSGTCTYGGADSRIVPHDQHHLDEAELVQEPLRPSHWLGTVALDPGCGKIGNQRRHCEMFVHQYIPGEEQHGLPPGLRIGNGTHVARRRTWPFTAKCGSRTETYHTAEEDSD